MPRPTAALREGKLIMMACDSVLALQFQLCWKCVCTIKLYQQLITGAYYYYCCVIRPAPIVHWSIGICSVSNKQSPRKLRCSEHPFSLYFTSLKSVQISVIFQFNRNCRLCSPFSIHVRHILATSNIDILVLYLFSTDVREEHVWDSCEYSSIWRSLFTEPQCITP